MIDLVWCDGCSRLWTRSGLKTEGGSLACPACGRRLPTYRMAIYECPRCHRRILYTPGAGDGIVCSCEQAEEEPPASEAAGEEETGNGPEPENSPEPEIEQEPEEPAVENICWRSASEEEIACAPPRGKKIRYKDTLTLDEQQAACYTCGGKRLWVRGPAVRVVGFDSRDPEEILLAYRCGENTGLPPMVNTGIMIYDLRARKGLTGEPSAPVLLAGRMGFLPAFCFDLTIEKPEKLHAVTFENEVPGLADLKEHVILHLTWQLAERVKSYAAEGTLPEAEKMVQEHLESCMEAAVQEDPPGADWGLRVEEVRLTGCRFLLHLCPVCHQPVGSKAEKCGNGHPLRWCPVCGEVQDQGVCVNGHHFRLCPLCGWEVLLEGGKCPRHGSLGFDNMYLQKDGVCP